MGWFGPTPGKDGFPATCVFSRPGPDPPAPGRGRAVPGCLHRLLLWKLPPQWPLQPRAGRQPVCPSRCVLGRKQNHVLSGEDARDDCSSVSALLSPLGAPAEFPRGSPGTQPPPSPPLTASRKPAPPLPGHSPGDSWTAATSLRCSVTELVPGDPEAGPTGSASEKASQIPPSPLGWMSILSSGCVPWSQQASVLHPSHREHDSPLVTAVP